MLMRQPVGSTQLHVHMYVSVCLLVAGTLARARDKLDNCEEERRGRCFINSLHTLLDNDAPPTRSLSKPCVIQL